MLTALVAAILRTCGSMIYAKDDRIAASVTVWFLAAHLVGRHARAISWASLQSLRPVADPIATAAPLPFATTRHDHTRTWLLNRLFAKGTLLLLNHLLHHSCSCVVYGSGSDGIHGSCNVVERRSALPYMHVVGLRRRRRPCRRE